MIEHLPQELRDRFTELREMDLSVQSKYIFSSFFEIKKYYISNLFYFTDNMDTLDKRVRTLFGGCRRGEINTEQANIEFSDIRKGYNRTIEEADEKVLVGTQMYELVDRYLRRLGM